MSSTNKSDKDKKDPESPFKALSKALSGKPTKEA
jgi:hypothetical protein